ncbi:MAG: type II toxin-antitoxin system VapC family toxin [bacterium]
MTSFVVDASVAVKWLLPEVHSEAATRLLKPEYAFFAPDLLYAEVGNALWKRRQRDEITNTDIVAALKTLDTAPIEIYPSRMLLQLAMEIGCRIQRTIYDSIYLSLAALYECRMVTADRKLHKLIEKGLLKDNILWIEDVP